MPSIKKLLTTMVATSLLAISGCGATARQLPSIPGVTSTSITLYINSDSSGAILDGHVDRGIEKHLAERYVRSTYGLNSVVNLISVR